ncbi:hypothetical protein CEE37_07330 [candidate division LCP-89 bacterium B3_LCP]|uniref:Uncharacterized protein n=1 Tax=candidate division LCP-89 bacterium B3_LCP TaxID=2012998 RepID=A0A532V0U8_UNCL8|nr:MAG: hypothetical protein CEE37_07330 [candidate division LCP-89 bacterium B3_LCP]
MRQVNNYIFLLIGLLAITSAITHAGASLEDGIAFFEAGRYSQAEEVFQELIQKQPDDTQAILYLGRVFYERKEYDSAIDQFEETVAINDETSDHHFWLGAVYGRKAQKASIFKRIGLAKKTKRGFLRAIELNPDHVRAREALVRFYLQAPGIVGGSKKKAYLEAEEIKKRDSLWAHKAYARIYKDEEEFTRAEGEYLAAIEEDPADPDFRYLLNDLYYMTEEYGKASQLLEKMLIELPDEVSVLFEIGRLGAASGENLVRAEECLEDYLKSETVESDPAFDRAHYYLGQIYQKGGKIDQAKAEYQQVLKLNPKHKQAKKALKRID